MDVPAALQPFVTASKFDRGELTVEVSADKIVDACRVLKNDLDFVRLTDLTAVDRFPAEPRYEMIYHLQCVSRNERLRIKARVSGADPKIETVSVVWRAANWYEREVLDLFGITILNHPNPLRIMMPDDWEGHPLRKDYPVHGYK